MSMQHSDWTNKNAKDASQKHLRCTMVGPDSSYSPLEIHICWKVLRDERIEPPIHTEYFRSGGATTLIFMVDGANAVSSLVMRSPMPANMVVPPESTTLLYKSLRMSTSHFMISRIAAISSDKTPVYQRLYSAIETDTVRTFPI